MTYQKTSCNDGLKEININFERVLDKDGAGVSVYVREHTKR